MHFDWRETYRAWHDSFPAWHRKPVIGITGNFGEKGCELAEAYYHSVREAGATPLITPPMCDAASIGTVLDTVDGLLLSGGADINPLYCGEDPVPALHGINPRRDAMELLLVRMAFDRQIPILGICRGIQVMTVALGGSIWQDIYTQQAGASIKHSQDLERGVASHWVDVVKDSTLYNIMEEERLAVNSFHHQAVRESGPHLRVVARSSDGVVEAVESCEQKSLLGVQWHPECFLPYGDSGMMPIFRWLVQEAALFAQTRWTHRHILTLDSHEDTPMFFGQGVRFDHRDSHVLVDLHKLDEGMLDAGIMVAYLPQKERDEASLQKAVKQANAILDQLEEMVKSHPGHVALARTSDDLYRLKQEGRKAIMMGVENGYALGKDLDNVKRLRDRGVVYLTLCHNGDNDICDSCRGKAEHGGLSDFGRSVVKEMNRVGMLVDMSHAAESSFWNVLELSTAPIVCSHSCCRALCDHPRNLTDAQMKALAAKGGVMQITLYGGFLRRDGHATLRDVLRHINHAVRLMGIEHVGIGTDFDGDGGVPGVANVSELPNLTKELIREGYSVEDLRKLWGGNFLRIMNNNGSY